MTDNPSKNIINNSPIPTEPINPKAATKTNKEVLEGLEQFQPERISDSGKNVYSAENKKKILEQLQKVLDKGFNLTMAKKALSVHHNLNTGTLDNWRKAASSKKKHTLEGFSNDSTKLNKDSEIEQALSLLETIDSELQSLQQKAEEVKRLLNHIKV